MHDIKILCITPIEHIPNIKNSLKKIGNLTIIDDPSPEDLKDISTDFEVIFTNPNKSKNYIERFDHSSGFLFIEFFHYRQYFSFSYQNHYCFS